MKVKQQPDITNNEKQGAGITKTSLSSTEILNPEYYSPK
jgi:hypothetical protein